MYTLGSFMFRKKVYGIKDLNDRAKLLYSLNEQHNIIIYNLKQFNAYLSSTFPEINKNNKKDIQWLADKYMVYFTDFRRGIIKTAKKKELIQEIINVNQRTIQICEENLNVIKPLINELIKDIEKSEKIVIGRQLVSAISSQKEDYIRTFDDISDGLENWNGLMSLIEDGFVTIKDLTSYGIDVTNIKLYK